MISFRLSRIVPCGYKLVYLTIAFNLSQEEEDDAYLKYESENDTVDENIDPVNNANPETDNDTDDSTDIDTVHRAYQETKFPCGIHPEPEREFAEP